MPQMTYYSVEPPTKWKLGEAGKPGTPGHAIIYAGCADCHTPEAEIAGFLGTGPTFNEIGVIPVKGFEPMCRAAMFCPTCFGRRMTEAKHQEAIQQAMAVWRVAEQHLAKARGVEA